MREIALHLLDIAENSVAAHSNVITITVHEDLKNDILWACIEDDGRGMNAETVQRVLDPFYTTRTTRKVGLGIPLLKLAAEQSAGQLNLTSQPGKGTRLEVTFQHSHIDRMPLGDLAATFLTLLIADPQIHWVFNYQWTQANGQSAQFAFDDSELKAELGDLPMTEPEILGFVRAMLTEGIDAIKT